MKIVNMHTFFSDDLSIGNKIHVLGCGVTGVSVLKFLANKGYEIFIHDEADIPKSISICKEYVSSENMRFGSNCYQGIDEADTIIISPGISVKQEDVARATKSGVQVIGDVDLFMRLNKKPVVLVSGSNGKSTVSALLGEVLNENGINAAVCGNYGVPVLDALEENYECYVIEISSFQLETTPNIHSYASVLLNVSEDHMDRYESFNEYYLTKLNVYKNTEHKIINLDEDYCDDITLSKGDVRISTKIKNSELTVTAEKNKISIYSGDVYIANEDDFKLIGKHNIFNITVVIAIARLFNIPDKNILSAISKFPGLEHRTEYVANILGVTWINDSKATNVGATIAAITGISAKIILILGGVAKDASFTALCQSFEDKVKQVIVFGKDKKKIINDIKDCISYEIANDIEDVVNRAKAKARVGDVVLFSPACASFDMFDNYQHRGNVFKDIVRSERTDYA